MEQIMNQTDVKVSFYLKKSEADARGNCPVMARLIVGKHSETAFSVKFRVPQSLWSSGRACGKSVAARDINNRLDEIRAAALGIYAEQSAIREDVTAEDVKHQLLGMASEQETLLSYFRLFIRNFEKRVGINRTEKTIFILCLMISVCKVTENISFQDYFPSSFYLLIIWKRFYIIQLSDSFSWWKGSSTVRDVQSCHYGTSSTECYSRAVPAWS